MEQEHFATWILNRHYLEILKYLVSTVFTFRGDHWCFQHFS